MLAWSVSPGGSASEHRHRPDGQEALGVDGDAGGGGEGEGAVVDRRAHTRRQVGVVAGAVGRRVGPDVGGRGPHLQTVGPEGVGDRQVEGEGVPGSGGERGGHDHRRVGPPSGGPGLPPHQAVDGVAPLGLGEGQLVGAPPEGVAAVAQSVRPRQQGRPVAAVAAGIDRVGVEDRSTVDVVGADPAADLHHRGPLVAVDERHLRARGHRCGHEGSSARKAMTSGRAVGSWATKACPPS